MLRLMLLLTFATAAHAQSFTFDPLPRPGKETVARPVGGSGVGLAETDTDIRWSSLRLHTPGAARSGALGHEVVALTRSGLKVRAYDFRADRYDPWQQLGNPERVSERFSGDSANREGWDTAVTVSDAFRLVFSGLQRGAPVAERFVGAAEYDPAGGLSWEHLRLPFATLSTGTEYFSPRAHTREGRQHRIYGNGIPRAERMSSAWYGATAPLVELRGEPGAWRFHDHGTPYGGIGQVYVGPSGAGAWYSERRRVFLVATAAGEAPAWHPEIEATLSPSVWLHHDDQGASGWLDLGAPPERQIHGTPVLWVRDDETLVVATAREGLGPVSAWYRSAANPVDPGSWSAWTPLGAPGTPGDFRLTARVHWHAGMAVTPAALHVMLFGYHDHAGADRLVVLERLPNGTWHWRTANPAPSGARLRVTSAVAIDFGSDERLTAFVRDEHGGIWEYARERRNGQVSRWAWRDLSYAPVIVR